LDEDRDRYSNMEKIDVKRYPQLVMEYDRSLTY
jgi:hypothetical protein